MWLLLTIVLLFQGIEGQRRALPYQPVLPSDINDEVSARIIVAVLPSSTTTATPAVMTTTSGPANGSDSSKTGEEDADIVLPGILFILLYCGTYMYSRISCEKQKLASLK